MYRKRCSTTKKRAVRLFLFAPDVKQPERLLYQQQLVDRGRGDVCRPVADRPARDREVQSELSHAHSRLRVDLIGALFAYVGGRSAFRARA